MIAIFGVRAIPLDRFTANPNPPAAPLITQIGFDRSRWNAAQDKPYATLAALTRVARSCHLLG
jgi:hypothetical protein